MADKDTDNKLSFEDIRRISVQPVPPIDYDGLLIDAMRGLLPKATKLEVEERITLARKVFKPASRSFTAKLADNGESVTLDGTLDNLPPAVFDYLERADDKVGAFQELIEAGAQEMAKDGWVVDINMAGLFSMRPAGLSAHDDSLPLVTGVTYGEARSIIALVGRKLWRAGDSPSNRPYVWSWPLPAAPDANYMEFYMATRRIGPHAIHQAREMLRLHMPVGDLKPPEAQDPQEDTSTASCT